VNEINKVMMMMMKCR